MKGDALGSEVEFWRTKILRVSVPQGDAEIVGIHRATPLNRNATSCEAAEPKFNMIKMLGLGEEVSLR